MKSWRVQAKRKSQRNNARPTIIDVDSGMFTALSCSTFILHLFLSGTQCRSIFLVLTYFIVNLMLKSFKQLFSAIF